ncbi:radical SAM family heme chaperone HemW [Marinicella meishanensis]|uniref:radical SAM family heme chaperone HemW n=1 Tax=Marinicella meishanensis TaxID=2873263 RepID=UPI001CC182DC|nr:radical SAM family heme chaperone HemW [Marinicella sp. NBU2979]
MLIPPKLSLYIHFPWCVRKCPYCDFNSHALKQSLDEAAYLAALQHDLEQDVADVWGRPVNTIFMGGGTPSLFSAEAMQSLLQHVRAVLPLRPDAEVTMEVNPGSQEFDQFGGYLEAGINRLSFGIQSLDDQQLKKLGRIHDRQQAQQAVQLARQAGFDNFNLDLMFGLPGQSLQAAKEDLLRLLDWAPTHVSYYQLTIEPNTLFAVKTPEGLPDVDLQHDMYLQGREILAAHGFEQYEVSAYAQADRQCEHNLNYWQFGDYLGIGAGAHSKITLGHSGQIRRQAKQKHPATYQQQVGHPKRIVEQRFLDASNLPFEFLLNHLRLKAPFTWEKYHAVTGLDSQSLRDAFEQQVPADWYVMDETQLQLTETGFLMSDAILQNFI